MKKNAFTLIEIVIVIAIIGIMALVSIPAFGQYEKSNQFDTKVEEITALFNRAYALSQSPVRSATATSAEYVCDRVDVSFNGSEFKTVLKKKIGTNVSPCSGNTNTSVLETVKVNDPGSLPMQVTGLGLDPATGLAVWTFTASTVYMPSEPTTSFIIETVAGSDWQKQIAFNLSNANNNFSIKNGQ